MTNAEFEAKSYQHALDHIDEPRYVWMKTEQLDDYDMDNYLDINLDDDNIIIKDKTVHPEYRLSVIQINNKVKRFNKKMTEYIVKLSDNKSLTIRAEVSSNKVGLLDIELKQKIISLKMINIR